MFSSKPTFEEACKDFQLLRNCSPFRFSGKWYVVKQEDGFHAYRTKKAAAKHAAGASFWFIEF